MTHDRALTTGRPRPGTPDLQPVPVRQPRRTATRAGSARPSSTTRSTTRSRREPGVKYTASLAVAGGPLGRDRRLPPPRRRGDLVLPPHARGRPSASALERARGSRPTASPRSLPYYQRYFLGGEHADPRLQHPDRRPHRLVRPRPSAATSSSSSTPSTTSTSSARSASCSSSTPARPISRTRRSTSASSARRRARSSASSCPCSTYPSASSTPSTPTATRFQPSSAFKFAVGTTF